MLKNKQLKFTPGMSRKAETGEKTQTRRPIEPQPSEGWYPYAWCEIHKMIDGEFVLKNGHPVMLGLGYCNHDGGEGYVCPYGKPDDHFEWDGQEYEITDIRVERVQDISEEDAQTEGMQRPILYDPSKDIGMPVYPMTGQYKDAFKAYWDFIYAAKDFGWDANPWVWVIEFRRVANA